MWKDWFYYSRGERRVIILLLFVLTVMIFLVYIKSSSTENIIFIDNTEALVDSLKQKIKDSDNKYKRDSSFYKFSKTRNKYQKKRNNNSDRKYPYNATTYESMMSPIKKKQGDSIYQYKRQEKYKDGTTVDLNTADTVVLKKVPGIGSVISRNIVRYRDRLGGFYDVNQLLEVKYVEPHLLKWFKIETGIYRKLKVNSDEFDVLMKHPYMNYQKTKAIINYRQRRGKLKALSQLSVLSEFTQKDLERLEQYFDFQ